MALKAGRLGAANLAANADTLLYTVPAGTLCTADVRLTNCGAAAVKVRLAIGTGAAPAAADYLDYDALLLPAGVLTEAGIPLSAGEKVWVRSNAANVSAQVRGFEEAA